MATLKDLINSSSELADSEAKHCLKMSDKLQSEAIEEIDKYYSGDSGKDLKKRVRNLAIKWDKARENILENKKMFLDTISMLGLMGLTKDETADFVQHSCLDLDIANLEIIEKLDKEYIAIMNDFNEGKSKQLKGRKTTATKTRKPTARKTAPHKPAVRKPAVRRPSRK